MKNGIRFTKQYLGIQPHRKEGPTTVPIGLTTPWRIIALIARLVGVYLLLCAFWFGWHYAVQTLFDIREDIGLAMTQDLVYNTLSLVFLLGGMSLLLWIIVNAHVGSYRLLRKRAHQSAIQTLERI
jgi:hypothetical protein